MLTNKQASIIIVSVGLVLGSILGLGLGYLWGSSGTVNISTHNKVLSKVKELKKDVEKLGSELSIAKKEGSQLKTDLSAEIARKNQLAVENTRLLGHVSQGQKDLSIVASKQPTKVATKRL